MRTRKRQVCPTGGRSQPAVRVARQRCLPQAEESQQVLLKVIKNIPKQQLDGNAGGLVKGKSAQQVVDLSLLFEWQGSDASLA